MKKQDLAALAAVAALYAALHFLGVGCPIKAVTGVSCAGCGMTRAAYLLLHGHPGLALRQNPFIFLIPVLAYMGLSELSPALCGRQWPQIPVRPWMLIVLGALVLAFTVARNLLKFL